MKLTRPPPLSPHNHHLSFSTTSSTLHPTMQSSENKPPPPEDKISGGQKGATQDHQPPHKCPRCDSSNTKFCYYNNYSLSQPRHFCKTCRRYWTRGGSLRNIPIGGGCRKTKKLKSAATRLFSGCHPGDLGFQLHHGTAGVYTQTRFISGSGPAFGLDLFGLNYPEPGTTLVGQGSGDHKISISSIESLSSINQEMHWKLQQQRLALVYDHHDHDHDHDAGNQKEKGELHGSINLFRNLEFSISNNNNNIPTNICGDNGTKLEVGPRDWSFEPTNYAPNVTTTTANSDINREEGEEDGAANVAVAWSDLHQFNGLQ